MLYKHGRRLVGDRTAKSRLLKVQVSKSQFADDLALYAPNRAAFKSAGRQFVQVGAHFGLTVSTSKTKGLAMGTVPSGDIVSSVEEEGGVGDGEGFYLSGLYFVC